MWLEDVPLPVKLCGEIVHEPPSTFALTFKVALQVAATLPLAALWADSASVVRDETV